MSAMDAGANSPGGDVGRAETVAGWAVCPAGLGGLATSLAGGAFGARGRAMSEGVKGHGLKAGLAAWLLMSS